MIRTAPHVVSFDQSSSLKHGQLAIRLKSYMTMTNQLKLGDSYRCFSKSLTICQLFLIQIFTHFWQTKDAQTLNLAHQKTKWPQSRWQFDCFPDWQEVALPQRQACFRGACTERNVKRVVQRKRDISSILGNAWIITDSSAIPGP